MGLMMTKEIIIDGVDVSRCEGYRDWFDTCVSQFVNTKNSYCKDNPDCYYKQLQREKKDHKHTQDLLDQALKENEELREIVINAASNATRAGLYIEELKQEKQKLEQELKEKNLELITAYGQNQELEALSSVQANVLIENNEEIKQYKQTLKEVREIADQIDIECIINENCNDCNVGVCTQRNIKTLIAKIKEVTDEV